MNSMVRQRGLGLFGFIFVFAFIGFFAMLAIKITPLYLNEMTIRRDISEVATQVNSAGNEIDISELRRDIEKRFDVDYISQLEPKDIKVVRSEAGLKVAYDYEARVNLFANVFVVIHFAKDFPIKARIVG